MSDDFRVLLTERLELRAVDPDADLEGLFPIFNDPASWEHAPDSRHLDRETTRGWLERATRRWASDGLSYWTVRRREDGAVIGSGGTQREATGNWNLFWRVAVSARGRGYASELGHAALQAAHAVDETGPAIAWIRSHNLASIGVARRLGLIEHSERVDPSDGVLRLPYADRVLEPAEDLRAFGP